MILLWEKTKGMEKTQREEIYKQYLKWKNYLYTCFCFNELLSYILWEQLKLGWNWGHVKEFLGGFYFEKL